MHWRFTPYAIPLIIATIISAWLVFVAWRRRSTPGRIPFGLLMLGVGEWSLTYAVELGCAGLPTVLFWDNLTWVGAVIGPAAWLAFALQYTGRARLLTPRLVVLLTIEPLITLLLAWTNTMHGLTGSNVRVESSNSFSALVYTNGPWFWINIVYSYVLLLLGAWLIISFIRTLVGSAVAYRGQVGALVIAVLAPWLVNAITTFGFSPFPHLDLTPLAFTITGLAMAWSLFCFRLLDIVPVARHAVVESMSDAVIVLDQHNRITDLNPAAQRLFGRPLTELIGRPVAQVASAWSEQVQRFRSATEAHEEIVLAVDGAARSFDLRISPLSDHHGSLSGRLIVLRDVTERKQAMEALERAREEQAASARDNARLYLEAHRQRQYFEALMNNSPIAVVSADLDDKIVACNPAFEKVFACKQAEITGRNVVEVVSSPAYHAEVIHNLSRIKKGEVVQLVTRRRHRDLELLGVPVMVEDRV